MFDGKLKKANERVAELAKELLNSQAALADAQKIAQDPDGAIASMQKTIEEKNDTIKSLRDEMDQCNAENAAISKVNDDLSKKIEELSGNNPADMKAASDKVKSNKPSATPVESFESGGDKFIFISPSFVFRGQKVLASEAMLNQALLDEIVSAKLGIIKKV